MATATGARAIPGSYPEALAEGWRVVDERTPLIHGEGRLLLCKDGVPESIAISYQPTATGYRYSTPQVAAENVATQAEDCWESHYREFGCAACETKDATHAGYGLCRACIERVSGQLDEVIAA
jgi:hypothetical protein